MQGRLYRSLKLWSFYVDLEESLGTLESTKAVYYRILELRIATPQIVLNFAEFLKVSAHACYASDALRASMFAILPCLLLRFPEPAKLANTHEWRHSPLEHECTALEVVSAVHSCQTNILSTQAHAVPLSYQHALPGPALCLCLACGIGQPLRSDLIPVQSTPLLHERPDKRPHQLLRQNLSSCASCKRCKRYEGLCRAPVQENKFWEEAFQVFEKGVALFRWPHVQDIWRAYLSQFVQRYGGSKLERARDLFKQALGMVKSILKPSSVFAAWA